MAVFRNTGPLPRVWPNIADAAGVTLELAPGETADLDLPAGFTDPYLRPVAKPTKPVAVKPQTEPITEPAKPDTKE